MATEEKARCSATTVRRLLAGELTGEARAQAATHLLACEKCRAVERELAKEREQLLRDVPFEVFASGVAERLAKSEPKDNLKARLLRFAPLLAAACVLVVAVPVALNRHGDTEQGGIRTKGGALVQLYVKDAHGVHPWAPGEGILESADVQAELKTAQKQVAVLLVEGGQSHVLFSGFASQQDGKPRVVAFGWTGGHSARLIIAAGPRPLDATAVQSAALQVNADPERWPGVVEAQSIELARAR